MGYQEDNARAAYEAYSASIGGVAFNGDPLPAWDELVGRNPKIADGWRAAAEAVAANYREG